MPEIAKVNNGAEQSLSRRLLDLALSVLPAIGGTIGFLGFVAVIGGAIQWVRFTAVHLPASQAVDAIPQSELVAIGAQYLIAFTIVGVFAVVVLYVVDRRAEGNWPTARALLGLAAIECLVVMMLVSVPAPAVVISIVLAVALAVIALLIAPATMSVIREWHALARLRAMRADWDDAARAARFERAYYAYLVTAGMSAEKLASAAARVAACERALADAEVTWADFVVRVERVKVERQRAAAEDVAEV
jgi:hypothetical protein